jgi:hypothetical protein
LNYPSGIGGLHYESFADVDCDGDLDLYYLGRAGGQNFLYFFENTGTSTSPDFSLGYTLAKANGTHGSFVDIGGDGDLDLIVGGSEGIFYYENPLDTCTIVSSKDLYLDAKLNLYPNPASNFLTFELESHENLGQVGVEISNMLGQKITCLSVQSFNNTLQETISLKGLPSGFYLLKVSSNDKFLTHKFVKQ